MRGFALFAAGMMVGLGVTAAAQSVSRNQGVVGLSFVSVSVPDLNQAVEYYTKTLGFAEAYRQLTAAGGLQFVMVQVSKDTFIQLEPATPQRPPGIEHFALQVENLPAVSSMFKQRGATVSDITINKTTKMNHANLTDPNGIRTELIELPPDSPLGQAMALWH
ncbi:MAG TPA: VOC family protein [Xanthobacteraceae bacterium]|jgi:catechol 2,3-dioxygenase-like lactoylglutathione lyase family enzyme|nr:VOC family protein [Xanthobacteraceae bacterium]